VDASSYGVGGVVFGELSACTPTVFRWQWPEDIHANIKTLQNQTGTISNLDLEMAGFLVLWLVIEGVCGPLQEKRITLFCDNSPSIGWATRLASKQSMVAEHLVQALAMHLKIQRACPLTPMHIEGKCNAIADIPSRLFGSNPLQKCETDSDLLTLFNSMFHLPNQQLWTIFHLNCELVTRVTSALQMRPFKLDDWRQLPKIGRHVGNIGVHTSTLWEWIHTCSIQSSRHKFDASQGLQHELNKYTT
jgi:hypothetical protein